ncbi:SPFH domain-containing protein, partial [Prevotella sp. KH2C16]|uniref:SPFH domain-containing protein n=1 Tax=Prevotella sp. KH2C16 TaxID=1855325 RepID=UPI0008E0C616
MELKNFFKRQLRTVIEWKEQDASLLFHRMETTTDEIKNASKLIVAPGQGCLVVYDGKVMATLTEPGIYEMATANHPFITTLLNLAQQMESEHKMRFYFFRTAELVNVLWGTASPVKYIEPDYQLPVALGVCGNFSVRIADAACMFTTLLGTVGDYRVADVQELVSSRIVAPLTAFLASKAYPYREVDRHLMELSADLKEKTGDELLRLGLTLTDFRVDSVTFDEDTMERIGKIADMTAEQRAAAEVDLDYTGVQKLAAMRDAARNEGGLAGAGLQVGAGVQLAKDIFAPQAGGSGAKAAETG